MIVFSIKFLNADIQRNSMGLNIQFINKPGRGIHIVVDDGCKVDLNKSKTITKEQKFSIEGYGEPSRGKYLYYFNKSVTDEIIK